VIPRAAAIARQAFADSPLKHPRYRYFYLGSVATAIGYTMQATVAAWLMATLTTSTLMVALVQTASTAPTLVFGFAAGTLSDIVDRRRVIIATQAGLFACAALLGAAALLDIVVPVLLLLLVFATGACFTFYQPAQQSSINELVGRSELPKAVALNAVAFNVARAIGPALAGLMAATLSSGNALAVSAAFFVPMGLAMLRTSYRAKALPGVPETLWSGIQAGLRYARHSPAMRAFVFRNLAFALCASVFWALLPLIARDLLKTDAGGFGLLSATFGLGAVTGALSIPKLLKSQTLDSIVTTAGLLFVVAAGLLATTHLVSLALLGAFCVGMSWTTVFATLSAGTQSTAPAWVRARAVAINFVAVQTSIALGSVVWGLVAALVGLRWTLAGAAALGIAFHLLNRRFPVAMGTEADVTPGARLPDMALSVEPLPDDGPVLIQIEYRIDAQNRDAFLAAIQESGPTRRRNGATSWRVFRDLAEEGRYVERFVIASWAEFLRLRSRMTVADRALQERAESLQRADVPIRISRLLGVKLVDGD
jgi:MFS family permease